MHLGATERPYESADGSLAQAVYSGKSTSRGKIPLDPAATWKTIL